MEMYVVATFIHTISLEMALTDLEERGVRKDELFVIPLDKRWEKRKLFDSIHQSDGISLLDGGAALGTVFMLCGGIYGYRWEWGPIIWGLIGLFVGFTIGFALDFLIGRKKWSKKHKKNGTADVVVMVYCTETKFEMVERVLWENNA